jgi:hypothetical protein
VLDGVRHVMLEYYGVTRFNNNAADAFVVRSLHDGSARNLVNLNYENSQILNLIQAMIGAVTPNFRRVTLEAMPEGGIRLGFLLQRDDVEDREEIDDLVSEFEALQDTNTDISFDVIVDARPIQDVQLSGRIVYGRKE